MTLKTDDIISELQANMPVRTACPDEASFKRLWQAVAVPGNEFESALRAGARADRLSWVFVAAYQSAVRACFPDTPERVYSSFAVSEDASGEKPGTYLSADGTLHGCKTWIASSRLVDHLVVTIGPGLETDPVEVTVGKGVDLTHRDKPGFLGEMSQGFACFDGAVARPLTLHKAGSFGLAEPFFVMAAGAGYLLSESLRLDISELQQSVGDVITGLADLYEQGFDSNASNLLALHERFSPIGKRCAEAAMLQPGREADDWKTNGRLLGMYGRMLRARLSPD